MAAPTYVQDAESTYNSAGAAKATTSFTISAGDYVVDLLGTEAGDTDFGAPTNTLSLTFTELEEVGSGTSTAGGTGAASGAAGSGATGTVTSNVTAGASGSRHHGHTALTFSGSDGFGAAESITDSADSAATLGITTTQANSAIAVIVTDWNAADRSAPTWSQVNGANPTVVTYYRDSARYTVNVFYYADAGSVGAKTVGYTNTDARSVIIAIEVLGTAGGGETPAPILVMPRRRI